MTKFMNTPFINATYKSTRIRVKFMFVLADFLVFLREENMNLLIRHKAGRKIKEALD